MWQSYLDEKIILCKNNVLSILLFIILALFLFNYLKKSKICQSFVVVSGYYIPFNDFWKSNANALLIWWHIFCDSLMRIWKYMHIYISNGVQIWFYLTLFVCGHLTSIMSGRRGGDRMVAGFTTTYAISAYHH